MSHSLIKDKKMCYLKRKGETKNKNRTPAIGRLCCFIFFSMLLFFVGVVFGGGGRVRTRNTLHIVGARKSSICYDAVERRKEKNNKNEKNEKISKMKYYENMIFLIFKKNMKKCSYSPKIGHFTYDFRVFSYIFLMFF